MKPAISPEIHRSPVAALLRNYRRARGKSQLSLALESGVSARHISFIESGRSLPGRQMVLALAETMNLPLRECNALLEAAGFAPIYCKEGAARSQVADNYLSYREMLYAHEGIPSFITKRSGQVLEANPAGRSFLKAFLGSEPPPELNLTTLFLNLEALGNLVENYEETALIICDRVIRTLGSQHHRTEFEETALRNAVMQNSMLREKLQTDFDATQARAIRLRREAIRLSVLPAVTILAAPTDALFQGLQLESFFPASVADRKILSKVLAA